MGFEVEGLGSKIYGVRPGFQGFRVLVLGSRVQRSRENGMGGRSGGGIDASICLSLQKLWWRVHSPRACTLP